MSYKSKFKEIYKKFGKKRGAEILLKEYHSLSSAELDITKLRWTIYTAFLAISMTLSGYLWSQPKLDLNLKKIGLIAGFFVHLLAVYFYLWLHRTAIIYREYLKEMENEFGFERYSIRLNRPKIGTLTIRFYWGIIIFLLFHLFGVIIYLNN